MATKTLTQQRFESLVKDHVAPVLKAAGFKKQGLNFRRRWGESGEGGWHVINIQKSQWGNRDSISFTINIGLACDLYTRFEGKDPAQPPTEPNCCWRMRIGMLMKDSHDHWWELDAARRFEHPADEVARALRELVLPKLARLSTRDGVQKSLRRVKPGKYSPGWEWNPLISAVMLRDQPKQQAKAIAALRRVYADSAERRRWIEVRIRRMRAK